jgi:hypothetical protein
MKLKEKEKIFRGHIYCMASFYRAIFELLNLFMLGSNETYLFPNLGADNKEEN